MAKTKTVSVHFELLEYVSYFFPTLVRCFLIWSFSLTNTVIPYMILVRVIIPFVDFILPLDMKNRTKEEQEEMEKDWRYLVPLYTYTALELYFTYWLLNVLYFDFPQLSIYHKILFLLTIGTASGGQIMVGHELTHRKEPIHYFFGIVNYFRFLYTNFGITHTQGHHKWVATPLDPASAAQGESVYPFAIKSMYYSFWQGWNIEKERLLKESPKINSLALILKNHVFQLKMLELTYLGVICSIWNLQVTLVWIVLAFLQQFGLEAINYIEHYGLRRKEIAPGKYEKTTIMHSWNAAQRVTNAMLLKIQRHSDHHENGYKHYQSLCSYEQSPQLPHGYGLSLNISLQPKLWFEMMDPLVNAYQNEHRQPTPEELKKVNTIASRAMRKNATQMIVLAALGLIF